MVPADGWDDPDDENRRQLGRSEGDVQERRLVSREVALAALNHPHIVTIHSVEQSEGAYFLTMELIEGKTLAELIPEGGLPLARFFELAIPIAEALTAAHRHGSLPRLRRSRKLVNSPG